MNLGISFPRISQVRKCVAWFLFIGAAVYIQDAFQLFLFAEKSSNEQDNSNDETMHFFISKNSEILPRYTISQGDNESYKQPVFNNTTLTLSKSANRADYLVIKNELFIQDPGSRHELEFNEFSTKIINLTNKYENISQFFKIMNNQLCFKHGAVFESKPLYEVDSQCPCKQSFFWMDCGIPTAVWDTIDRYPSSLRDIRRRNVPRRIINGIIFNHEFDMLEVRFHQLNEAVDVFIILESKFSSFGNEKPLRLFEKLQKGFLREFHQKIMYVCLADIPDKVITNGWTLEIYLRYYLGKEGLMRITGLQDDDLFVISDADEIPTADVMNFLKLYDGFPEPVGFTLKWNVFGFFWNAYSKYDIPLSATVYSATSIKMLREVFHNNAYLIRKENVLQNRKIWKYLAKYKATGGKIGKWSIGSTEHYAGWHCSWCFRPEGIILKMDSAQKNDTPRWGDFPEKRNIDYIRSCIRNGRWFDDKTMFRECHIQDPMFAPSYFTENFDRFKYLLKTN